MKIKVVGNRTFVLKFRRLYDMMSEKEKSAVEAAFTFLARSTNERSAAADSKARERGFVSLGMQGIARSTNEQPAVAGRGARYEILSHCGCASGGGADRGAPTVSSANRIYGTLFGI